MFWGSRADLRRRMREMSVRATAEPEEGRLEAGPTKSEPQILTNRLS